MVAGEAVISGHLPIPSSWSWAEISCLQAGQLDQSNSECEILNKLLPGWVIVLILTINMRPTSDNLNQRK
jgi:hypothetical protein